MSDDARGSPTSGAWVEVEPPASSVFHRLARLLWRLLVVALLLLAAYLVAVRVVMGGIAPWKDDVLAAVNARLPFTLQASRIEGSLHGFSPQIGLRDLTILFDQPGQPPVTLAAGKLRLNPLHSLLTLTPQISDLSLRGLDLQMARSSDGVLRLVGFEAGIGLLRDWLTGFLARVDALHVDSGRVVLRSAAGERLSVAGVELDLHRRGSSRTLAASLAIPGNRIRVHANGVGDPLTGDSWRGDVYLHLEGDHLERILAWSPADNLPLTVTGGGSLETWLSRSGGRSEIALRSRGENLVIAEAGGSWSLPLEALAMTASLTQVTGGWRLQASDLSVAHRGLKWTMPRARFQLLGDSLSARVAGMRLDGIENLLATSPAMPAALAAALGELRPRGLLTAAELSLDDVRAPADSWRFSARIDEAAVDSWRGAPGVDGLDALVELTPGGGRVLVDGRDMALTFPTVYRESLNYDELYGGLSLGWDKDAVRISSDLITARGEEGTARAVFSLDFPLQDNEVGPAMNLLVGLRDSEPRYRAKYLPFTLPEGVTRWLQESVGDGRIEQGGFVWRGSLRRRNFAHMTVQMFFQLQDTDIRFDNQWPSLTGFSGPVLIDDRRVSIWGNAGRIAGTRLDVLSAEMDRTAAGKTEMAVAARVSGDAAGGLAVVRDSPLAGFTAGALDDWRARGPFSAELHLRLPLSKQASSPGVARVDLRAALDGVELDIRPGRLPIRDLTGVLRYRSGQGFAGSDVAATLWGQPLTARHPERADAGRVISVALAAQVATPGLLQWLDLDSGLVDGQTSVSGDLKIAPSRAPVLTLNSDLEGMTLSLPAPWGKTAPERRQLAMELTLEADATDLEAALDDALHASLRLESGRPVAGELALESDWLQAVYSPTASPQLLVDWLDLDRLDGALAVPREPETPAPQAGHEAWRRNIYRFLGSSPETDVQILELRQQDRSAGHLAFRFERDGSALYARNIRGNFFGLRSEGSDTGGTEMRWSSTGSGDFATALDIDMTFDDLGAVFKGLGYAPVIESRSGSAVGSLRWSGTPAALGFERLQGTLQIQARDGRLLESPGGSATGALKVVTLLNLAELLQGLSLSSMFESGIPFERASSELVFNRGQLRIPALTLDGSASAFRFSGTTNLAAVDGELVVTLPVANNLPWVAALAAGLPVAAGVFVVSKMFEKQVERMSSGVYSVSGPLDTPRVRLKRIFDNTSDALPPPDEDRSYIESDESASSRR